MIKYDPLYELPVEQGKKIECPSCKKDIVKGISSPIHVLGKYVCVECGADVTDVLINACCKYERSILDIRKSRSEATKQANALFETIESAIYQLEQLEPLLEMPDRGYVRNTFNAVIRTLKEGI